MHLPVLILLFAFADPAIHVDQVGYGADAPKIAGVTGVTSKEFTVHRAGDGVEVFRGELEHARLDVQSGDHVGGADFSAVTAPGRYEIRAGTARSAPFEIASDPYAPLLRLTMRSYYGQRCGTSVDLGGGFSHPACHTASAFHRSSGRTGSRPPSKGWHDAGDYGRYVVNSGISTGTLLWAWELFPRQFEQLDLGIPESGNATPDLLDEVRWNLEWMLSMQDGDGGVWHKQTSQDFPGFVMPQDDHKVSFVIGTGKPPYKSSCATADFAAVMAIAGRAYKPYDGAFAESALHASKHAWAWLKTYPDVPFRNPRRVDTGGYTDENCSDERLWAAAELWRTARLEEAHAYLLDNRDLVERSIDALHPPGWQNVGALAAWTYVLDGKGDAGLTARLRQRSLDAAEAITVRAARHPYRIPMMEADYVWGSNGVAANYALQLLVANRMQPDRRYVEASLDVLHYLLGRNALGTSFVTGAGSRSVLNPHHRPSGGDGIAAPWPGLLSGGPNRARQDPILRRLPGETPPARSFADEQGSYASNEIAINWNAALVFVLAGVQ